MMGCDTCDKKHNCKDADLIHPYPGCQHWDGKLKNTPFSILEKIRIWLWNLQTRHYFKKY